MIGTVPGFDDAPATLTVAMACYPAGLLPRAKTADPPALILVDTMAAVNHLPV